MNRLLNTLFTLIKIDSPTGDEKEIVSFVVDYLRKNQLVDHVQTDRFGNVYARKEGVGEPIFLSDHLDTVEPGRGIQPTVEGGYVVSAGDTILGADDKSSVAAVIEALWVIKEQNIQTRPIEIMFTISEEVGNLGAVNFDYSLLKSKIGYCFDCTKPLGAVITSSPFYERFDITIQGLEAHASRPELGINVLSIFNKLMNSQRFGKLDRDTVFNIGVIEGGYVRNAVPGNLFLKGEIRSFSEQRLILNRDSFVKKLDQIVKSFNAKYMIEIVRENPGFKYSKSEIKKVASLIDPLYKKLDVDTIYMPNWGVSDTNIFHEKGLFCINTGGGREFAHTTRERIKISELEKLVNLILTILA